MENELKYETVKHAILNQIHTGELHTGDKLPNEEDYMKLFNVSGITIRKALTELANEGYIVRIKRKGSFVNNPKITENQSHLIALILSAEDYYDSSYMKIIKGAQRMAAEFNYSLIVEWSNENLAIEQASIQKMLDRNVDGFLIYPFDPIKSIDNFKLIEQRNIPYVLVDRYNLNRPCYFAGCNNHDGAVLATRELIRLKHTKIKFAGYHFFLNSEQERYDGYCSAMRHAGLPVNDDNLLTSINYDSLAESILRHDITALFCSNDKLAVKVMKQLHERGIRIPQDVSIMGFDDWDNSRDLPVALSTVKQVFEEIGINAANLLINAILGKIQGGNTKVLSGVSLVMRDSTSENPYS
ncbi:GntR family transcriptional regulator [Anaerocolumna chitinilytica]|uniref:DNA-binding transcriptional regulator CytR n=1 Tax=Anaerocolumna chitinilytica TaxID=1727145 RepID=A0A7I8DI29_9FIRM|nr:GntR family transcriptional regulator [Anaerocolumna chitinilytica]BCJ98010.1 DNA-binding transcriptional regulator CytR [Anaerocolumna chitinilytica]